MIDNKTHIEEEIWFSSVSEAELAKYDKDAAFAAFRQRVADAQFQPKESKRRLGWLRYAAAVVAVIAVGFFSYKGGQSQLEASLGEIVVEAPQGSRSEMVLPDGTKVWLNAGSKISYSQTFGYTVRLVRLEGEGYFEVAHNELLPFSVESGNVRVKVLGTKFNVRDYPSDAEASVSLAEGRVSMCSTRKATTERVLTPGQRATVNKESGRIRVDDYEVANAIQWTNGILVFDGESLRDIVNDLERCYNVRIIVKTPSLYNLHFYGTFIRQEQSLREVLDALAATGKIRFVQKDQEITLY